MRAAIYIRVSTEEQAAEGYSVSAQKQKLQAFCLSQDWEIAGFYADEGISAKDTNRPELQKMLEDIKAGLVDCVLVYRLDRLTRSVFDLYKLLEIFEQNGCKFKSATEVYDTTTAMGRMFITIVAALAQWERENMAERISFGLEEKARQGKYCHNVPPFGFSLDKKTYKLSKKDGESEVAKMIFDLYQQGYGMNKLAGYLNKKGLYTRAGNYWSDNTIMKVLRNETYAGTNVWKDIRVKNAHEQIIDFDTWQSVQDLIGSRAGKPPKILSSDYIFSGTLKCNSCGSPLIGNYTAQRNKDGDIIKYMQYRCRNHTHGYCKVPTYTSERKLENAFIDYLKRLDISNVVDSVAQTIEADQHNEPIIDERSVLEDELQQIEKKKKKYQFAWSDDVIEYEDFKARMGELRVRELEIKKELEQYTPAQEKEKLTKEEIKSILTEVGSNWHSLERIEKKQLVTSIIKQIHFRRVGLDRGYSIVVDSIDVY